MTVWDSGYYNLNWKRGIMAFLHWAIPEKKKTGVEGMEFPGVLKKLQDEFPVAN